MNADNVRVNGVHYAGDYKLDVGFSPNWHTRTVDLRESIYRLKGLKPLRDRKIFARAAVGEGGYSIVWPGDLDMSASRVLEMALEQAGHADVVEFIRWRWRNGLSLTEAAEALGLSRRQVAYYASGDRDVPRTVLLACRGWEAERSRKTHKQAEFA